jgi:hypothetical protein
MDGTANLYSFTEMADMNLVLGEEMEKPVRLCATMQENSN